MNLTGDIDHLRQWVGRTETVHDDVSAQRVHEFTATIGGEPSLPRTGDPAPLARMAEALKRKLVRMLPQLHDVRLSHVWTGRCAGTRDLYPHMGRERGIYYALGYCFAGVPAGTYFGKQLADQILGHQGRPSVFWQRPFRSIPLHNATPWFVPLAMKWYARNYWR